jgi:hypothetical protein
MPTTLCSICGRDPRGHLAPSADGAIVCRGCVADVANELEGKSYPKHCVCGGTIQTIIVGLPGGGISGRTECSWGCDAPIPQEDLIATGYFW